MSCLFWPWRDYMMRQLYWLENQIDHRALRLLLLLTRVQKYSSWLKKKKINFNKVVLEHCHGKNICTPSWSTDPTTKSITKSRVHCTVRAVWIEQSSRNLSAKNVFYVICNTEIVSNTGKKANKSVICFFIVVAFF